MSDPVGKVCLKKGTIMFSVCELCDVVVEKVFVEEEGEYGCPGCWEAYKEIH
jgi:hypothetical protein